MGAAEWEVVADMQPDLRDFLDKLDSAGLLLRVGRPVDARFELSAVSRKIEKLGKAVLFEHVKGYHIPVVTNVFGSRDMLALVFECDPREVVSEYVRRSRERIHPVLVADGPVGEVVRLGEDANMDQLPIVTHAEKDGGPFITAGLVVAKDPDTGLRNVSVNRMMYRGPRSLGCDMSIRTHHLGQIQAKAEAMGTPLEVAICIGNHPIETLAAATSIPFGDDEFALCGALRGAPLELVKCETVDLEVPRTTEIVLEGEILPGLREAEGPFGDVMQCYGPVTDKHVFQLRAITHRKNPIYQTIQASSREDIRLLALSREASIQEAVANTGARINAVSLGPTILSCAISIDKQFEGEPTNVAAAAFEAYPWLKYCIVVDADVDVFDIEDVFWAMGARSDAGKGLLQMRGTTGFPMDPHGIHTSKLGIDATAPLDRWDEFERKRVPGEESVDLADYLTW